MANENLIGDIRKRLPEFKMSSGIFGYNTY
jgi:hypothetical protein